MKTDKIQQAIKNRFELFRAENYREINRVLFELKKNGHPMKENQLFKLLAMGRYNKLTADQYYDDEAAELTAFITDKERNFKVPFSCRMDNQNRIEVKDRNTGKLQFEAEFMWHRYFYVYYHLCLN